MLKHSRRSYGSRHSTAPRFIRKHLQVAGCGLEDAGNVTEHSHSTSSRSSTGHRYTPVVCGFHYLPHIPNKKVYAHIPNKKDFDC